MTTEVRREEASPRAGIIGGGFMGAVHSSAVRAVGGTVRGVASSSRASAERAARQMRAPAFDSPAQLLAADIDVVHVCTPNTTHAEYAAAALSAGKHVICEKPLAPDVDTARSLTEQATASRLVAAVPFVYRYHPLVREARARVLAGEFGRLLTIDGRYLQDWLLADSDTNWRVEPELGGPSRAFADIGSHLVDLVEFITMDRIASLCAITSRAHDVRAGRAVRTEDCVAIVMRMTGGAIGTLLISQAAPGRKNSLVVEIAGIQQSACFDQENPELLWVGRRAGSLLVPRDPAQTAPDSARLSRLPAGHPMGYQDAFAAFVGDVYAAIGGGQPEGLPGFDDGLRAAQVTQAVLDSAAAGAWVEVPAARRPMGVTV